MICHEGEWERAYTKGIERWSGERHILELMKGGRQLSITGGKVKCQGRWLERYVYVCMAVCLCVCVCLCR